MEENKILRSITDRRNREARQKEVALTLLQQCKGEGMTVSDVERICEIALAQVKATTLRDGLTL